MTKINSFEESVFRFGENLETIVQKPKNPLFLMLKPKISLRRASRAAINKYFFKKDFQKSDSRISKINSFVQTPRKVLVFSEGINF